MTTKPDTYKLTPQQAVAVDALVTGSTVTAAAETVKVSRQTVSGWLHHNAEFQASLNARRQELWTGHVERLRSLVPKAMDTLEVAVNDEKQGVAVAVHILKAVGLYGLPAPSGSIHVDAIESAELTRQMVASW
jgi:transposase